MEALSELADNARRLLADADLVFQNGSHQTATSLAILALEEVGKFFQLKWEMDGEKPASTATRGTKAHRSKQATISSFYAAETSIAAVKEFVRNIGYPDDDQTVYNFLHALHLPDESAKQALEKLVDFVAEKMWDDEKSHLLDFARFGTIDRIKQQGLYADIDKDGKVVSSPSTMTRDVAIEWLNHARKAVERL